VARQLLTKYDGSSAQSRVSCLEFYQNAKGIIISEGYGNEIMSPKNAQTALSFSESDLMREAAWVILCTGFRESVVRRKFNYVSLCFYDWHSAAEIAQNEEHCLGAALKGFKNVRKLRAIVDIAKRLSAVGIDEIKERALRSPIRCFIELPYIGPVTAYHLAKNLGFNTAKNDRHLRRLSSAFGFLDAQHLCEMIAQASGDRVDAVDSVLWRFMTLRGKGVLQYISGSA
jgi:hypothetical protein